MELKAVIYMRYSTDLQTENSIEGQRRVVRDFAQREGFTIIGEYVDRAISGRTDKRPEFQRMIADVESGNTDFKFILVYKLDRFARNEAIHREYEIRLNKKGVVVFSATEDVNKNILACRFVKSLYLNLNEEEVRKISENVTRGKKEAAYKGQWCGGPPPLGYDYDPKTKKLVISEEEAPIIKMAFELRAQGFSYSYIIGELNKHGYKTKLGNEFGKNSLYDIFHNIKYKGVYEYNRAAAKSANGTFNRHAEKDESEIIREPDENLRIVSDEVWDTVNEMSRKNSRSKPTGDYLFSGLVKCKCGTTMQVNKRDNKDRDRVYYSFFCPKHKNKQGCDAKEINMEQLEIFVLSQLADKIFTTSIVDSFISNFSTFNDKKIAQSKQTIKSYTGKIEQNNRKIQKLLRQIEADLDDDDVSPHINGRIKALAKENKRLEQEIAALNSEATKIPSAEEIINLKKHFIDYMQDNSELPSRKKYLQSLIEGIFVYDDEVKVIFNL